MTPAIAARMAGLTSSGSLIWRCPVTPMRSENGSCPSPPGGQPVSAGSAPGRPVAAGSWRVTGHTPAADGGVAEM